MAAAARLVATGLLSLGLLLLGLRLLGLARRSGKTPERWLGLAFACAGAGVGLLLLAALGGLAPERARRLALAAQVGLSGAVTFLIVFAWRAFRPGSLAAGGLALGLAGANLAAGAAILATGAPVPAGALGLLAVLARSAALSWLFVESARFARRMRRRVALGLAEPLVANRFLLWSIWTGALAAIPLFVLALRAAGALEAPAPGAPLPAAARAALAVLGLGGAVALAAGWLAFFPPSAYRRWVASGRRAPA
ncbi:MAG: hypothetical protein OZ948_07880 [Deltaproteobacteria bacterium]|nr:hypothetical protein [Deltaproteobacteria bacterium]